VLSTLINSWFTKKKKKHAARLYDEQVDSCSGYSSIVYDLTMHEAGGIGSSVSRKTPSQIQQLLQTVAWKSRKLKTETDTETDGGSGNTQAIIT